MRWCGWKDVGGGGGVVGVGGQFVLTHLLDI